MRSTFLFQSYSGYFKNTLYIHILFYQQFHPVIVGSRWLNGGIIERSENLPASQSSAVIVDFKYMEGKLVLVNMLQCKLDLEPVLRFWVLCSEIYIYFITHMHLYTQLTVLVCVFAKWAPGFAGASEIDEAAVRNPEPPPLFFSPVSRFIGPGSAGK